MSNAHTAIFFDNCRDGVAELLEAGANMQVVEDMIDAYALPDEDKDALWLWASGPHARLMSNRADGRTVDSRPLVQFVPA
jgi:hypothetical protein